jgi:hypothetical protein
MGHKRRANLRFEKHEIILTQITRPQNGRGKCRQQGEPKSMGSDPHRATRYRIPELIALAS